MTKHALPPEGAPKEPWYKDAKIWHGHITMRLSVRAILLTVLTTIGILLVAALFVVNEVEKINMIARDNQTNITTGHKQRLADEAAAEDRENAKVAQLACSLVSLIPPGQNAQVDQLRVRYDCTPGAASTPTASGQPSSARPTGTPTLKTPTPSSTPQGQAPMPTATATVTTTRTTTSVITGVTTGGLTGTLCAIGQIIHLCSSP